jgi:P27 family predicted phage terminase small subunit
MGRPKTPTNILKMRGSDKVNPGRMKGRENEPKPAKADAKPPTWLSTRGRKVFRELAKITTAMDVLTVVDHFALAMIADVYDDYFIASEAIENHGATYTITNRDGTELVKANPAVTMKADAWRRVQSGLSKFGLDPSARAGLRVTTPQKKNRFEEFIDESRTRKVFHKGEWVEKESPPR